MLLAGRIHTLEVAIAFAVALWSTSAAAQELAVSLDWTVAAGQGQCIDRPAIVEKVEYTLDQPVFVAPDRAAFHISGSVGPAAPEPGWIARVQARGGPDHEPQVRELTTALADCEWRSIRR